MYISPFRYISSINHKESLSEERGGEKKGCFVWHRSAQGLIPKHWGSSESSGWWWQGRGGWINGHTLTHKGSPSQTSRRAGAGILKFTSPHNIIPVSQRQTNQPYVQARAHPRSSQMVQQHGGKRHSQRTPSHFQEWRCLNQHFWRAITRLFFLLLFCFVFQL